MAQLTDVAVGIVRLRAGVVGDVVVDEGEDAEVAPGVLRRLDRTRLAQVRQVVSGLIMQKESTQ